MLSNPCASDDSKRRPWSSTFAVADHGNVARSPCGIVAEKICCVRPEETSKKDKILIRSSLRTSLACTISCFAPGLACTVDSQSPLVQSSSDVIHHWCSTAAVASSHLCASMITRITLCKNGYAPVKYISPHLLSAAGAPYRLRRYPIYKRPRSH